MTEKKARREYGDGSIYRRKSDGRHVGSFYVNGDRKYVYGDTRKEAKQKLEIAQQQAEQGTLVASNKQKLADYLAHWLSVHKLQIESNTYASCESCIRVHLVPALGNVQVQKLTRQKIQAFVSEMSGDDDGDMAPGYIRLICSVLDTALDDAVKWKLIAANPCKDLVLPRHEARDMQVFDLEQVQHFFSCLQGHPYEALFVLALTTGMRKGELLGLHWSDIDMAHCHLQVKRTLVYVKKQGNRETDPKTASSRRGITLTQTALDALSRHRSKQVGQRLEAATWPYPDQVFTTSTGNYIAQAYPNRLLALLLRNADLPAIRFHDLRHTCATLWLKLGIHPKVVQELLGHSSIAITMNLYSHVLPNIQGDAMRGFNAMLVSQSLKKEAF